MADSAVAEFCDITGSDASQARQFLDASGGDLEVSDQLNFAILVLTLKQTAISSYFEATAGGEMEDELDEESVPSPLAPVQPTLNETPASTQPTTGSRRAGFATLGDLARENADPDQPQDLFAGGGKSGLNVQDPNQRNKPSADSKQQNLIKGILEKAAE